MAFGQFPADARIRRKDEFDRVYRRGARSSRRLLTFVGMRNELGHARLGLSVGRRVGTAVARNRIKRQLRELFRRDSRLRARGVDLIVQPRPGATDLEPDQLAAEFREGTRRLLRRLGI